MTQQPETDRDVQMLHAQHMRKEMGSIWLEAQSKMLISKLTESQKAVLEQFYKESVSIAGELEIKAGAYAMKALLEPQIAQHHVKAFFCHAKAEAILKGKSRVASQLWGYHEEFARFVQDVAYGMRNFRTLRDRQAAVSTQFMLGKNPLSEEYVQMRIESAKAQGEVEAYDDLLELFEKLTASLTVSV